MSGVAVGHAWNAMNEGGGGIRESATRRRDFSVLNPNAHAAAATLLYCERRDENSATSNPVNTVLVLKDYC